MKFFTPPRVDPFKHENPRYVAYCLAHGAMSPAQQRAADAARHGGKWMRPFVYWIGHRIDDWCRQTGVTRAAMGFAEQQQFTEWLTAQQGISEPLGELSVRKRANARLGS